MAGIVISIQVLVVATFLANYDVVGQVYLNRSLNVFTILYFQARFLHFLIEFIKGVLVFGGLGFSYLHVFPVYLVIDGRIVAIRLALLTNLFILLVSAQLS